MPEFLIEKFSTAEEMCDNILEETGVALLPGSDFGFSKERMIARLSFTDFNGENLYIQNKTILVTNSKINKEMIEVLNS